MSEQEVIYISTPQAIRGTERYKKYYRLIGRHFIGAKHINAPELFPSGRRWQEVLKLMTTLIFIRGEKKSIDRVCLMEIISAHNAGKRVFMAGTDLEETLVLTPFDYLHFFMPSNEQLDKRNWISVLKRRKRQTPQVNVFEWAASHEGGMEGWE